MTKVRKAVIPAAGLGTRFLPATKAQPKEMLPLLDKPAIQYVVEEAVQAGLTDIIIIIGRGKHAIDDHFDRSFELEHFLEAKGKYDELKEVREISDMAAIHYIRQRDPLGLGHAVAAAEGHVRDEPFAVLLGDDLIVEQMPLLQEMLGVHEKYGRSVLAAMEVSRDDISLYGCIEPELVENEHLARVRSIVEKPSPEEAPSNLAAIGRYVLTPEIFDCAPTDAAGRRRRAPAHRRDQPARPGAGGVRVRVRGRAVRRRQQARLPEGHGRARDRPGGHRPGLPRLARRLRRAQEDDLTRPPDLALTCHPEPADRLAAMATPGHVHDHDSGEGLLSVEEARERVLSTIKPLQPLALPLTESYGCVLAESLVAERDIPGFRVIRDGRVRGALLRDRRRRPPPRRWSSAIVGRAMIGERPEGTVGGGEAFAIATGAPVPAGADTIAPIETCEVVGGDVRILAPSIEGKHIRPSGEDVRAGETLVQAGRRLQAPELGLLATAGFAHPLVHPRPRVVVLSTGDELIPPTLDPDYGQVRDSNAYTLFAAIREAGAVPIARRASSPTTSTRSRRSCSRT